jgi:hypothetical protein
VIGAIMGLHSNGTGHPRDCWSGIEAVMQDMRAHLEKLKSEAEDCALISELAADRQKRVLFASLSRHLTRLASEVELAIQDKLEKEEG